MARASSSSSSMPSEVVAFCFPCAFEEGVFGIRVTSWNAIRCSVFATWMTERLSHS